MTQSGGLLNPPIDTPAPGTGAIDARVSPDGRYVAYWFVTTVNDPLCPFCVDVTNRALISRSDSFTNADEIGTPNTGGWPSWDGNTTLVLTNGSGTVWYYTIGMPEAAIWFDNSVFGDGQFPTLLDGEVSHDGTRFALVRGDNQETLVTFAMTGAIPAAPTPQCAFTGPTGKFVNPTWSNDGLTLAWKEDNGIWEGHHPERRRLHLLRYAAPHDPGRDRPRLQPRPGQPRRAPGVRQPRQPDRLLGYVDDIYDAPRPGYVDDIHDAPRLRGACELRIDWLPTRHAHREPRRGTGSRPVEECFVDRGHGDPHEGAESRGPRRNGKDEARKEGDEAG